MFLTQCKRWLYKRKVRVIRHYRFRKNSKLYAEGVAVSDLAKKFGTPLYVYSRTHLQTQYRALASALRELDPLICYSVKVNSNAAVVPSTPVARLNKLGFIS